jgi:hypothetical protein
MKLMRAKKQSAPVAIACIIAATSTAALAANNLGSPGSALDPQNYVPPPVSRVHPVKSANPAGEPQEETQSTTTFVTMPGFEPKEEKAIVKAAKGEKQAKVKSAPEANGDGLLSGVNDKFKSAGSGIASGTKAASDQVAKGTKAVGEGIANGAKASGNFFMKGARAIGSGTKKMGSKVAVIPHAIGQGAKAAGDNIKDGTHAVADRLPFTGKSGKGEEHKPAEAPKSVAAKQEDLKPVGEGKIAAEASKKAPTAAKPDAKPEAKIANAKPTKPAKPGIVGKTIGSFGKLNVFHKKGGDLPASLETAGKAPTGADVTH